MKLNLGCGFHRLEGYVNVDIEALCKPDIVLDLELLPWPWPTGSVTEIAAHHTLEHMGATTTSWMGLLKEMWRVCAPDAIWSISVPHPRHENFLHDPTHVRAITPIGMAMFDNLRNISDHEAGGQESKLGLMTGIDLEMLNVGYDLAEPWRAEFIEGRLTPAQAEADMARFNNVCMQIQMRIRVVKPARGEAWLARQNPQVT